MTDTRLRVPTGPVNRETATRPQSIPAPPRGPLASCCRLIGRLCGVAPDHDTCWCVRCTLHRLGVYRREHVRIGRAAYRRTTVCGVRIHPDRYAYPLDEPVARAPVPLA